jgi:hypothetical protein
MGSYQVGEYKDFYKGKKWFLENNPEAWNNLSD